MSRGNTRKPLAGVLPDIAEHMGWQAKLDLHSFFPRWEKVVRKSVSSCSRPLKIVRNVLWLEVDNSTWMQQLQFEKHEILSDINATLRHGRLRDIKFVLPHEHNTAKPYDLPPVTFVPPDPEAVKRFEKQVSIIEDDEIREALTRLWYLAKACRRGKRSE